MSAERREKDRQLRESIKKDKQEQKRKAEAFKREMQEEQARIHRER